MSYNVYFIIDENNFEYTTQDGKTELLLNVTDPNGNEVTNITGLVYREGGFDITTRTGGFLISADYIIETNSTITQNWQVSVTLVNLDSDQNDNQGKTLKGRVFITKEQYSTYELMEIHSVEPELTYNSIVATLETTPGTEAATKYYFGIEEKNSSLAYTKPVVKRVSNILASAEDVTYYESNTPSYTFKNLKDDTDYTIYAYSVDKYGFKSNVYETELKTNKYN